MSMGSRPQAIIDWSFLFYVLLACLFNCELLKKYLELKLKLIVWFTILCCGVQQNKLIELYID